MHTKPAVINKDAKKWQPSSVWTPALAGAGGNGSKDYGSIKQESPCYLRAIGNSPVARASQPPRENIVVCPNRNSQENNYHQVVVKESDIPQSSYGK